MKNQKSSMKLSPKVMRIVEVFLMNNTCEFIMGLKEFARSKKVSFNDCTVINSLILQINKDSIRNLRSIGFFDDNTKKVSLTKEEK